MKSICNIQTKQLKRLFQQGMSSTLLTLGRTAFQTRHMLKTGKRGDWNTSHTPAFSPRWCYFSSLLLAAALASWTLASVPLAALFAGTSTIFEKVWLLTWVHSFPNRRSLNLPFSLCISVIWAVTSSCNLIYGKREKIRPEIMSVVEELHIF